MDKKLVLGVFILGAFAAFAQEEDVKKNATIAQSTQKEFKEGWTKGGFFNINGSNVVFSNWSAGGTGQTGLISTASLYAIKKKGVSLWENKLDMAYGLIRNGGAKTDNPQGLLDFNGNVVQVKNPFVKSEDRFVFQTKYGRKISNNFNYAALFNFNTIMFPAFSDNDKFRQELYISDFASQSFGFAAVGIDFKPQPALSLFISPITAKYTYIHNPRLTKSFGNDSLQRLRIEMGWYVNAEYKKEIMKNIDLQTRVELFNSYDSDYLFKRIDINIQNTINMKVNKFITVSFITQLLYDDDVDVNSLTPGKQMKLQLKHFTGIGFAYKFGDPLP